MSTPETRPDLGREPQLPAHADDANPLGLDGLEFIEYRTAKPQALGQVLELMGFRPVARHRSREVLLYRQGDINVVVDAHAGGTRVALEDAPTLSAIALRVQDARAAYQHLLDQGAWPVPSRADVMELNIPAIHGPGGSRIYLVDRYREFSIYDIDFVPIPAVDPRPPAVAGLHFFGVVQYIGLDRSHDWMAFYKNLFGMEPIPDEQRFGIMPKGHLLRVPAVHAACGFWLQLVEPEPLVIDGTERFQRIGLGTPDVLAAVQALRGRGVGFVETPHTHPEVRGAVTKTHLGSVVFELVHHDAAGQ